MAGSGTATDPVDVTCGPEELLDAQWWHALAASAGSSNLAKVHLVQPREGTIVQSNCVIRKFLLHMGDAERLPVVLKQVDLTKNQYRDAEHRSRSLKSYQVERAFYHHIAPCLRGSGAGVPELLCAVWNDDCTKGATVLEDLSCGAASASGAGAPPRAAGSDESSGHGRSQFQRLALSEVDTKLALGWLATFHAAFWMPQAGSGGVQACVPPPQRRLHELAQQHLWLHGGYWSLDKRQGDLDNMECEWQRWQNALLPSHDAGWQSGSTDGGSADAAPGAAASEAHASQRADASSASTAADCSGRVAAGGGGGAAACDVAALAGELRGMASALQARLSECGRICGSTVLHGDFKAANMFFQTGGAASPAASSTGGGETSTGGVRVAACDFQWAGMGVCMQDVVYLLWTSVEPSVLAEREQQLLQAYRVALHEALGKAGVLRLPSEAELREPYEVAFLDYTRFLIGSMWGACTKASFAAKAGDINQGLHKRDEAHQKRMVLRAVDLVRRYGHLSTPAAAARDL